MSVSGASRPGASRPRAARAALLAAACASAAVVPSLVAVAAAGPAQAAPVVTVSSLSSSGAGTLRAAINAANGAPAGTGTTIKFSVHGTITLASALPGITSRVTIDGTSAPTYASGGAPVVAIDCNGRAGLRFAAGSARSQLLAVAVDDASGDGVTLNAGRITLNLNYIGLDLTGAAAGNHGDGVLVNRVSSSNLIGLNPSRDSGVVANVISGNTGDGIALNGSSGNTIAANRIGTSPAGTARIRNGGNGISLTSRASDNEIGGTVFVDHATGKANNPTGSKGTVTPVFVVPPLGNLISGNGGNGVWIATNANRNSLNGNFVGTTASGNAALGNALNGVWIDGASGNSLTGCRFVNNPFVYYNVLSGNGRNGLRVTDSANTTVQGNFFGTGANNSTVVANRRDGVRVDGSSVNTQVGGVIPLGNVSAGNGRNGIEVAGTASGFTTFNTFGGLFAFGGAAPNGRDGLLITSTGGGNLVRTNVMSGNTRNGIEIGGNASGVTVVPNIAGLNTSGGATLPNGGDGLRIDGTAHGNTIGGTLRSVIPQNTFSGNAGYGIAITRHAHANKVILSYIGTSLLGTTAMGNQKGGILIGGSATRNQIGALDLRPFANLISGNTGNGVTLRSGTRANLVLNNYIGLNRFARSLPNSGSPVVNNGTANIIRGNRT
jgi:parallel beta-helix repeat protein